MILAFLLLASIQTTVTPQSNGQAVVTLTNGNPVAVTAIALTWSNAVGTGRSWGRMLEDAATAGVWRPIAVGGSQEFPVGTPGGRDLRVKLQAALFEDGSAFGDPGWVKVLMQRRVSFYRTTAAALREVQTAPERIAESEQRQIAELDAALKRGWKELMAPDGDPWEEGDTILPRVMTEERRAWVRRVYGFVLKNRDPQNVPAVIQKLRQDLAKVKAAKPEIGLGE